MFTPTTDLYHTIFTYWHWSVSSWMIVLMIFLSQYFSLRCWCWLAAMLTRLGYSALCSTAGPLPRPSLVTAGFSLVSSCPPGLWLVPGWAPQSTVLRSLLPGPGTQGWLTGERGASTELWGFGQPGLDTQLRDNNLAEWPNAHNFSINWSSEHYTQGRLPCKTKDRWTDVYVI